MPTPVYPAAQMARPQPMQPMQPQQTLGLQTPVYPAAQMARPQPMQPHQSLGLQTLPEYAPHAQPGIMQAPGLVHAGPQAIQGGGMLYHTGSNYTQVGQPVVGDGQMAGSVYQPINQHISSGFNGGMSHDGNIHQPLMHPPAAQMSMNAPPMSSQSLPSTAVSQAAILLRDGAQAMSQLGLAYKSASLGVARPVARKLELSDTDTMNAPRPSASETLHADVRQSQSWPSIAPESVPERKTVSRQVPTVNGSLPRPTIPSSAAVLLSAPKQMQSPQVSGASQFPPRQR